jgi:hypothetical protein
MRQSAEMGPVKQEIINYVRNNPGSSKADIIRHIKNRGLASRITVIEYIKDLESSNLIYEKRERPNSQSLMIYINENNKLVSVLAELDEFGRAYANLLKKSKEKINNKDYSADAKLMGINESDPSKWEEKDRVRYLIIEIEKLMENADNDIEYIKWRSNHKGDILKSIGKLEEIHKSLFEVEPERQNRSPENRQRLLSEMRSKIIELSPLLDDRIRNLYNVRNHEVVFLILHAIIILRILTEIIFIRTTLIWPNRIRDKYILANLHIITYGKLSEIQVLLSDFFRTVKIGQIASTPIGSIISYYQAARFSSSLYYISQYQVLGMDSEIMSVTNSLQKVNEEIKDYHRLDLTELDDIHKLHKMQRGLSELLKEIDSTTKSTAKN